MAIIPTTQTNSKRLIDASERDETRDATPIIANPESDEPFAMSGIRWYVVAQETADTDSKRNATVRPSLSVVNTGDGED